MLACSQDARSDRIAESWSAIREGLRQEIGGDASLWTDRLVPAATDERTLSMIAPSAYVRDHVQANYAHLLYTAWLQCLPDLQSIVYVVAPPNSRSADAGPSRPEKPPSRRNSPSPPPHPTPAFRHRCTFESFVAGECNGLALGAALDIAESDPPRFDSLLYLHADDGQGKTHLLHAVGHRFGQLHPGQLIRLLTAEEFTVQFIEAVQSRRAIDFKTALRNADLLLLDDIDLLPGKSSTQEELLHTLNTMIGADKRIVICGSQPPDQLDGIAQGIRSRLAGGLVAHIRPPDSAFRLAFLRRRLAEAQQNHPAIVVAEELAEFLAENLRRSVRALESAVARLVAEAELVGEPMTCDLARDRLQDVLSGGANRITLPALRSITAAYYQLDESDLDSARRDRAVAQARQVVMFLAKQRTGSSLSAIGAMLGGRSHSTVLHAIRQVERRQMEDAQFARDLQFIARQAET